VFVTRPAAEAEAWVDALRARGWPVCALPLIDIVEPQDGQTLDALRGARARWLDWNALMFVSPAAVHHFFAQAVPVSPTPEPGTRFWAPGPGTARVLAEVLERHGVSAACIDAPPADAAQFDSEHLWPVVAPQMRTGSRLLVVRGASKAAPADEHNGPVGNGRDWLIERCQARGASVDACVAYERHAPRWTPALRAEAEAGAAVGSLWLFSSSEALAHLREALPQADWSRAAALCTHERIAASARAAGFAQVIGSRPALSDVLGTLESVRSHS
jgi:uroporphyrinogen-III synthase